MKSSDIDRLLMQQSSEFIEALKRGEPRELAKFGDWLRESRTHVRHMLMMVAFDLELNRIDPERRWKLEPGCGEPGQNVIALTQPAQRPNLTRAVSGRLQWRIGAAVAASVLAVVGFFLHSQFGTRSYATGIGEQRAVELDDGSVIHLNTQSRVRVRYSAQARDLELLAGEALFKVHRDAARPFRVHTSDAIIQAVGTQFNVYRRRNGTTVSVLEGRVRVSSEPTLAVAAAAESTAAATTPASSSLNRLHKPRQASLGAGEQARIDHSGEIATLQATEADLSNVAAWRQRRLVFKQSSLADVVTEFNRYNRESQFSVRGTGAANRRYSGIFDADDPESLIALLESEPDLVLERNGDTVVVRERP